MVYRHLGRASGGLTGLFCSGRVAARVTVDKGDNFGLFISLTDNKASAFGIHLNGQPPDDQGYG